MKSYIKALTVVLVLVFAACTSEKKPTTQTSPEAPKGEASPKDPPNACLVMTCTEDCIFCEGVGSCVATGTTCADLKAAPKPGK